MNHTKYLAMGGVILVEPRTPEVEPESDLSNTGDGGYDIDSFEHLVYWQGMRYA